MKVEHTLQDLGRARRQLLARSLRPGLLLWTATACCLHHPLLYVQRGKRRRCRCGRVIEVQHLPLQRFHCFVALARAGSISSSSAVRRRRAPAARLELLRSRALLLLLQRHNGKVLQAPALAPHHAA